MKKILGISLVAVLAATPLMARAADLTADQLAHGNIIAASENNLGDANRMATVSYVKGAYTELGTAINTKADKTALEAEASARELADQGLQSAITTLNGDSTVTGSVDKKIADAISTVNTAASDLAGRVTANETAIGVLNGSGEGSVAAAVAAEATLRQSADNTLQSNITDEANARQSADRTLQDHIDEEATARTQADTAINNKIGATALTTTNQTLTGAIEEVKQSVSTLSGAANTTYAKKVGVTQTISDSTISGTVPVVTDWANQTAGTVAINASITGAEYAEPAGI